MLTAEVANDFFDPAPINVLNEAVAVDRAYGAGVWIEMTKLYEEEERYAVYLEGDHADRRLCPACRAQWEVAKPFTSTTGFMIIHAEHCAYLAWRNALND